MEIIKDFLKENKDKHACSRFFISLLNSFGITQEIVVDNYLSRILTGFNFGYDRSRKRIKKKLKQYSQTNQASDKQAFIVETLTQLSDAGKAIDIFMSLYRREDPISSGDEFNLGESVGHLFAGIQYGLSNEAFILRRVYFEQADQLIYSVYSKLKSIYRNQNFALLRERFEEIAAGINNEDQKNLISQMISHFK